MSAEISRVFRSSFPASEFSGFRTASWSQGVARSSDELQPLHATLLHAFAHAAKSDASTGITLLPDLPGGKDQHKSFRALYHEAMHLAVQLKDAGLAPGDRVLLVLPTSHEFVTSFFAVQMAGGVPVPSYPPATLERAAQALERLSFVARHSSASLCITNKDLRTLLGGLALGGNVRDILSVEALNARPGGRKLGAKALPADPAFIQYTSGSTGDPKGVLLTHANVVANIHAMGQAMRINRNDVGVSWLPLYHDMGLIGALLTVIYWRLPLALMSPTAFLSRPVRWLETVSRFHGTLSPAPNFAYGLVASRITPEQVKGLDLSAWRVAFNGAEPVNARTVREFQEKLAPAGFDPGAMLPVYGLAEASLAVAFPDPGTPARVRVLDRAELAAGRVVDSHGDNTMSVVSVGRAVPGHDILVVDEAGVPVSEGQVGHVVVKGPSVMKGYWRAPDRTAEVLRDDALWTGDLGFVEAGELYVTGRAKDLIIVRGRNYYAEDLERIAARVTGVRPGGLAAFGVFDEARDTERVVLVCETRLADTDERKRLVAQLAETVLVHTGLALDEVVLARPGTLPKTSSGKTQRALARTRWLANQLDRPRGGKMKLALLFARSQAGFIAASVKRLLRPRRAPD